MSYEPKRFDFSIPIRVNLSSDTQTKPSRGMKEAMMEAEVGDEQMGSDPTIWALCDRSAALLGKEAAVFLPSGTMCNQVAIATHCRPGEEILAHESSHILSSEGGAPAAIAGALITGLKGERGHVHASIRWKRRSARCRAIRRRSAWWRWSRPPTAAAARAGASRRCARSPMPRTRMGCPRTWMARG